MTCLSFSIRREHVANSVVHASFFIFVLSFFPPFIRFLEPLITSSFNLNVGHIKLFIQTSLLLSPLNLSGFLRTVQCSLSSSFHYRSQST